MDESEESLLLVYFSDTPPEVIAAAKELVAINPASPNLDLFREIGEGGDTALLNVLIRHNCGHSSDQISTAIGRTRMWQRLLSDIQTELSLHWR